MNENIEVIGKHIIGVKFSLIPFIKEIQYKEPINQEDCFLMSNDGIILLNADKEKLYTLMKKEFSRLIKMPNIFLSHTIKKLENRKNKTPIEMIQAAGARIIIESRKLR